MTHRPYPEFQLECITTLVDVARRGAIREELPVVAKCGYELGGSVLKATIGEPDDVLVGSDGAELDSDTALAQCPVEDLDEAKSCLATALPMVEEGSFGASDGTEADAKAIDPVLVSLFIQAAMKAIEYWLSRKGG